MTRGNDKVTGGTVTDLSRRRLRQRETGETPRCGSPLANSKKPGSDKAGKTCTHVAGWGTDHLGYGPCKLHTGQMPTGKKVAARERAEEAVEDYKRRMTFYGEKVEISPEEALLEEVQRAVGVVRWIEAKLGQWGGEHGDRWDASETGLPPMLESYESIRSVTISDTEYAAWLRQYTMERQHLARSAKMCIDAGIAKQVVQIYQRQADVMHMVIRRTLVELGVGEDDRLPTILPRVIREITSGKAS